MRTARIRDLASDHGHLRAGWPAWLLVFAVLAGMPGCSGLEKLFGDSKSQKKERTNPDDEGVEADDAQAALVYGGARTSRFLMKVLDEGKLLVLDDGSVWSVEPRDQIYTGAWVAQQTIMVQEGGAPPHYKLVNPRSREQVVASYLGTPPESSSGAPQETKPPKMPN